MKSYNKQTTRIDQDNIVSLSSPEKPQEKTPWFKQLQRLHKDGHKEFRFACTLVRRFTKKTQKIDYWGRLMDDLEALKKDPFWFNAAIEEIGDIYEKAYTEAEIFPFNASKEMRGAK